jgi:hypothetical protein
MKKIVMMFVVLSAHMGIDASCCDESCSNRTVASCDECVCAANRNFFSILNLPWDVGAPVRLAGNRNYLHEQDEAKRNNLQIAVFGGRSTRSSWLSRYFSPTCSRSLCSRENIGDLPPDTSPTDDPFLGKVAPCDMYAGFFGIDTNGAWDDLDPDAMGLFNSGLPSFQSNFKFSPRHEFAGVGFSYRRHFCYDREDNRSWWFEIGAPVMWVKHQMNMDEDVVKTGGSVVVDGMPANMTEAFANSLWNYGRIDCVCDGDGKVGLADVDVRIGYEIVKDPMCHFVSYLGGLIPTGTKPHSRRVFEPIIGHNKHGGVMFGTDLGIRLWHSEERDSALWSEITIQGLYLIRNTQTRILSLNNRPWSQYMQVFESEAQAEQLIAAMNALTIPPSTALDRLQLYLQGGTPGVNVFAQEVRVAPAFQRRLNTALVFAGSGFEGELGYNFFSRDDECVTFDCPWPSTIALKNPVPMGESFVGDLSGIELLNPDITINDLIPCRALPVTSYDDAVINACDIDLRSAASPGTIVHTVYAAAGYQWEDYKNPCFVSLGSSYEFTRDNTGLNEWTVWAKAGINF